MGCCGSKPDPDAVLVAQVPPWATLNGAKASPAYLVPTGQILTLRGDGVPQTGKPVSYVDESGKVKVQVCVATSSAVTIRNAEGAIIAWSTSENTTEKNTWGQSLAAEWQVFSTQPPFAGEQPTASFENVHGHLWGTIKRYPSKAASQCYFNYNLHLVAPGTKSVEPQASYYARETGSFPGAVTLFLSNLSGPVPVALKHDRNASVVSVGDGADTLLALVMLFLAVRDRQKHDA